jgi:hypothetical protein
MKFIIKDGFRGKANVKLILQDGFRGKANLKEIINYFVFLDERTLFLEILLYVSKSTEKFERIGMESFVFKVYAWLILIRKLFLQLRRIKGKSYKCL